MNRLLQFIGLATIILTTGYTILYLKSNNEAFNESLRVFGLISFLMLIGYIIIRFIWGKSWMKKGGVSDIVSNDLVEAFNTFLEDLPNPSKSNTSNLLGHLIYRFTRLGVFSFLIALIPIILLWQQNQLLNTQNDKLEDQTRLFSKQNDKIDSQIQLEESNRRGALIVMMSNIMDKVDDELKISYKQGTSRMITDQLVGRIVALSYAFRPYRFWQDSMLTEQQYSPERGQLLLALVNSDLDSMTYRAIYEKSTFEGAYLNNANLKNANLRGVKLQRATLNGANLINANLRNADLEEANLTKVLMARANLVGVDLKGAIIKQADMTKANLTNAYASEVNLRGTTMEGAKLRGADLAQANLAGTNLRNADLSNTILIGVKVKNSKWLEKLEDWNVKGISNITQMYFLNTSLKKDTKGEAYYFLHAQN